MTDDPLHSALLDARVPRYTSYPPANRFSADVGPNQSGDWLGAVATDAPISVYVHVPFCRRLCWFCACRTQGTTADAPLDRFLDHLDLEAAMVAARLPRDVTAGALHLGGGTPTILSPDRIARLSELLHGAFTFTNDAEISVEIDPVECDEARLSALAALGTTRASLGVQDFDPIVQAAIGREQSVAATRAVVDGARARGIESLNVDLVYGLPHQTEARIAATLETVLDLRPDRLALFGYAHVPWMARRQRMIPEDALPLPVERIALAARAREMLVAAGYREIGIDHFALPDDAMAHAAAAGTLRRNFQGYTTDRAPTLIGLGPSSISRYAEGFAQNAPATGAWQARIAEGMLGTVRGHALTRDERMTADIIERIMCDARVDLAAMAERHDQPLVPLLTLARAALADLPGVGTLEGEVLRVGRPAALRLVAAHFDPGFAPSANLYSQAS
ncbi:Oxygen-independent coproporphyrinogen-III oxidase [Roseivivax jejudonensis]|uniref:Coproporphyrinogen-III oxidase n=1 Tax=Roseivivax jejudonensis TaxID=1529041 RepID=A0A1X6ZC49_9RHOB|nr:oxygen-independent coproporphyrinogen III oxidase [Roseivivax jejudonensis]SLN46716.1 Oxygen-independent coproporphyrinogen-III oxidase [Roseivivax jejudonensis]